MPDAADRIAWVRDLTGGRGADVVFNCASAYAMVEAMHMARPGGRLVEIAHSAGADIPVPPLLLFRGVRPLFPISAEARHFYDALEEAIRRAAAVHPIADLQIEYSVLSRGIEDRILPACRELGIGITAYGVLSRGLLSSSFQKRTYPTGDLRNRSPRFESGNLDANLLLVEGLRTIAKAKGLNVAQLAFAWVTAQGTDIVPLVGARRPDHLSEALGSLDVKLTTDDLAVVADVVPREAVAGTRYGPAQMADLDSEQAR